MHVVKPENGHGQARVLHRNLSLCCPHIEKANKWQVQQTESNSNDEIDGIIYSQRARDQSEPNQDQDDANSVVSDETLP